MTIHLLNRMGPSILMHHQPGCAKDIEFRNVWTNLVLDSFAPDPWLGTLRVPLLRGSGNGLKVSLLHRENAAAFSETAKAVLSAARPAHRVMDEIEQATFGRWILMSSGRVLVRLRSRSGTFFELIGHEKGGWLAASGYGTVWANGYYHVDRRLSVVTQSYGRIGTHYDFAWNGPALEGLRLLLACPTSPLHEVAAELAQRIHDSGLYRGQPMSIAEGPLHRSTIWIGDYLDPRCRIDTEGQKCPEFLRLNLHPSDPTMQTGDPMPLPTSLFNLLWNRSL